MVTIIFTTLVILAILITLFYFKGKHKKTSEKSSSEKISDVIVNKFKRGAKDLADGMRDAEYLKNEVLAKLNEAKANLQKDCREYLTNLITSRESINKLIRSVDNTISDLKAKSKKYKTRYEQTKNITDKEYAEKYIAHILTLEKSRKSLKDKLKIVIDKIDNAESVFEYQASVLEIKRVDVLNMTCLPDVNIAAKLTDVNDILEEFKQKLDTQNINSEVDSIMNSQRNDDIVDSNVSDDEVAAFYDKL
jgi:hypothetical protein